VTERTAPAESPHAGSRGRPTDVLGRPRVLLVGPRADSRGGVAATVRALQGSRLTDDFELVVVSTYRDGGVALKALEAARGLARMARLCAGAHAELVHLHASARGSFARKVVGIAIARATRVPVVLHVHSGSFFEHGGAQGGLLAKIQGRAVRWALESADGVVALTAGWERSLAGRGRLRRSTVIPNAPDLTAVTPARASESDELILFLGHLYRDKGVYELLEAFATLRATRPSLRLVLAGEGSEAEALRAQAQRLGLDGAVELPGWVDPSAKVDLLARAACFVLPSYREGLPLALLEAMVVGAPIVATPVGGVPDVVQDGRHALLVPPTDVDALVLAIGRLLDEPRVAERLARAAQERALAEYTPDALAERVGTLYRTVLARPASACGAA
jgi:glycosyltransferase involved in cell wall biosynthesis